MSDRHGYPLTAFTIHALHACLPNGLSVVTASNDEVAEMAISSSRRDHLVRLRRAMRLGRSCLFVVQRSGGDMWLRGNAGPALLSRATGRPVVLISPRAPRSLGRRRLRVSIARLHPRRDAGAMTSEMFDVLARLDRRWRLPISTTFG